MLISRPPIISWIIHNRSLLLFKSPKSWLPQTVQITECLWLYYFKHMPSKVSPGVTCQPEEGKNKARRMVGKALKGHTWKQHISPLLTVPLVTWPLPITRDIEQRDLEGHPGKRRKPVLWTAINVCPGQYGGMWKPGPPFQMSVVL